MKKNLLFLVLFLAVSVSAFAQEEKKIYYDADWQVCSPSKAEFYRLISFDEAGKPVGKIRDYYITGELQWEGYASYVDKYDNSKDISEGLCTWYYKNGNKSRESTMVNNIEDGVTTYWYENGNKLREAEYSMGELDGLFLDYYQSGKLRRKFEFSRGEMIGKFFTECDEFGSCEKVFVENFLTTENTNEWPLVTTESDYESRIKAEEGLLMETGTEMGFRQTIRIPLDLVNDFSIETIVDFKGGSNNTGHGLIWGFKDWDNYYYFNISANGYYRIGAKNEGINLEFVEWTTSDQINKDKQRNLLKLLRVSDKMYFSINGNIVHSEEFYSFRGNEIGFAIGSGEKEVLFENLVVRQDIPENNVPAVASEVNSSSAEWKGNGTGFFIDKNGYIATNYHVVKDATEIEVEMIRNGVKQNFPAKVIQSDAHNDISIIKINSSEFKPFTNLPYNLKTALSDVGSNVFALGYPMALSLMGTEIKFTDGKISSKTGLQGNISTYQISVPIQPGNSGGPLFDYDGNLVGITSSGVNRELDLTENVNYAIKTSYLKNLIDVLPYKLSLPNDEMIASRTLTEKIKILSDYVVLIKLK